MPRIVDLIGTGLRWEQPGMFKQEYVLLTQQDEQVATLRFRSAFGSLAIGESADGCWSFKRVGFWKTRVTVRTCDEATDLAAFHNNTWSGGGTLELADGRSLRANTNFWHTSYEFTTPDETALIRLHSQGVLHLSARVELLADATGWAELPWLVMLSWYLTVLMYQDSASVAAAV